MFYIPEGNHRSWCFAVGTFTICFGEKLFFRGLPTVAVESVFLNLTEPDSSLIDQQFLLKGSLFLAVEVRVDVCFRSAPP